MYNMVKMGVFFGENFAQGRKAFGLKFSGAFATTDAVTEGIDFIGDKPLTYLISMGLHYKYYFNPYSTNQGRWALNIESGAFISSGLVTGYVGAGFELSLINRYSIAFMPLWALQTEVQGDQVFNEQDDGSFANLGSINNEGTWGGLGYALQTNITWESEVEIYAPTNSLYSLRPFLIFGRMRG